MAWPSMNGGGWGAGWGQSSGGGYGGGGQSPYKARVPNTVGFGRAGVQPGYVTGGWDPTGMTAASAQASGLADQYQRNQDMWDQNLWQQNAELQHKFQMEQLNAQLQANQQNQWMQLWASGMNLPTADQIERSRGDLSQSLADYGKLRDNGRYNAQEMNTLSQDAWNSINNSANNQARSYNTQMQSLGLGSNPGASAALGMAGKFAANAARGGVMAGLTRENKEAQERGIQGYAGISGQLADYASRPINRMGDFDPWGMLPGSQNPEDQKKKQPIAFGNGQPWTPKAGGGY